MTNFANWLRKGLFFFGEGDFVKFILWLSIEVLTVVESHASEHTIFLALILFMHTLTYAWLGLSPPWLKANS